MNKRNDITYVRPADIPAGTRVISKHDFDVVYADPPWDYNQKGNYGASKHYGLMTVEEIKAMPVRELVKENAVLFLWSTNGAMPLALEVLEAWGFKYRSYFVWCKNNLGLGEPLRNSTEICLVGIRGRMPSAFRAQMNWGFFPRQDHSHKPEEMFAIMERLYPHVDYLELFARRRSSNPHWYIWGNEAEGGSDIYIPGYPVPEYSGRVEFIPPDGPAPAAAIKPETVASEADTPPLKEAA